MEQTLLVSYLITEENGGRFEDLPCNHSVFLKITSHDKLRLKWNRGFVPQTKSQDKAQRTYKFYRSIGLYETTREAYVSKKCVSIQVVKCGEGRLTSQAHARQK